MFKGFIDGLNQSINDPSIYELIITDFYSDDCNVLDILKKSQIPYKLVKAPGFFSRGKGLHLAALNASHSLLMFLDIDMLITSPVYWAWIRKHTARKKVVFPICYGLNQGAPYIIEGNSKRNANGKWRKDGYGMCAMHRDTYLSLGGWDHRISRWGGEDNDLYWHCQTNGVEITRKKSNYLFHRWHPETSNYKDIYGDKSQPTLQGKWRDPLARGVGIPDPAAVLDGYDD